MKPIFRWTGVVVALFGGIAQARAQQVQDNVVIVLDASGSMSQLMTGTSVIKMDAAKAALRKVLGRLPAGTHVGLLVFSGANVANEWIHPLGPRDDAQLNAGIDRIKPDGGTPLGQFIKKGADRLLEQRAAQFGYGTFRLLIVTDGEAQDKELVERFIPEVIARGLTVDVIGVSMDRAHTLARKVHSYRAANDPAALERAVSEVLAEIPKTRTDVADQESFAVLAPIPTDVAAAALQALATSGNTPIGGNASVVTPTTAPGPAAPTRERNSGERWMLIVGLIIVYLLFRPMLRKGRGR